MHTSDTKPHSSFLSLCCQWQRTWFRAECLCKLRAAPVLCLSWTIHWQALFTGMIPKLKALGRLGLSLRCFAALIPCWFKVRDDRWKQCMLQEEMRLQPRFNQHYTAQAAHVSCSMKSPIDLHRSIIWVTSSCIGQTEFGIRGFVGAVCQEFASCFFPLQHFFNTMQNISISLCLLVF